MDSVCAIRVKGSFPEEGQCGELLRVIGAARIMKLNVGSTSFQDVEFGTALINEYNTLKQAQSLGRGDLFPRATCMQSSNGRCAKHVLTVKDRGCFLKSAWKAHHTDGSQ